MNTKRNYIRSITNKILKYLKQMASEPELSKPIEYFNGNIQSELESTINRFRPTICCPDLDKVSSQTAQQTFSLDTTGIASDEPVCRTMLEQIEKYLNSCKQVSLPIANGMQRLAYQMVPYINSSNLYQGMKDELPCVGLVSHHNSGPRDFLIDSLNGIARVEIITSDSVIKEGWEYLEYEPLEAVERLVRKELCQFDYSALPNGPRPDRFAQLVSYQIQLEMSLANLLKRDRWQMIISGDTTSPLSLAFFDTPREKRPPLIHFGHGSPYGYPMMSMWTKVDWLWVRGPRDRNFFQALGYPKTRIIPVGCPDNEGLISFPTLQKQKLEEREKHGIGTEDKVLLYAVTWDPELYKTLQPAKIISLLTACLEQVVKRLNNTVFQTNASQKLWLFLKYHPYPSSDPLFDMSRLQYPLDQFLNLKSSGWEIRLTKEMSSSLKLADCFLAHESTSLAEAIQFGIPTISLDYCQANGEPTLGRETYTDCQSHKFLSIHASAEDIGNTIFDLLKIQPSESYEDCKKAWSNVYQFGRTEGLMRIISESKCILDNTKFLVE